MGRYSGVYSATKYAVGAISEALRQEQLDSGIRVTLIEPGRVETELRTHVREEVLTAIGGAFANVVPLTPEQVSDAILYAVSQPRNVSISEILLRPSGSPM